MRNTWDGEEEGVEGDIRDSMTEAMRCWNVLQSDTHDGSYCVISEIIKLTVLIYFTHLSTNKTKAFLFHYHIQIEQLQSAVLPNTPAVGHCSEKTSHLKLLFSDVFWIIHDKTAVFKHLGLGLTWKALDVNAVYPKTNERQDK